MQIEDGDTVPPESGNSHYGHLFRLLHWVLTIAFVLLLLTGLSLHAIARPDRSLFSGVLPDYLWSGHVHLWHFATALVFCPSLLAALLVCPRRVWFRPIYAMLSGGGLVMIVTGLLMHGGIASGETAKLIVWLHGSLALMLLPFAFLWHAVTGLTRRIRLLIPAFHPITEPQWGRLLTFLALAPVAMWLMLACWPLSSSWRTLVAVAVSPQQSADVDVAQLPWEHLKTSPKDESIYYEDKFAMMFPIRPDWRFEQAGCALYCHAGGGNPYGCKYSERLVDEWHWKAVRSDPVGQADDRYVSYPESETKLNGRRNDPEEKGGGYKPNGAPDQGHPAFLPGDPSAALLGAIRKEQAMEYTEQRAAEIPPGTIIPGMICAPFVGDRGDVKCQSTHHNGRWALFLRRKLDTGSEFDVRFEPGRSYAFSFAAFDHATKRHAYSLSVFRLLIP